MTEEDINGLLILTAEGRNVLQHWQGKKVAVLRRRPGHAHQPYTTHQPGVRDSPLAVETIQAVRRAPADVQSSSIAALLFWPLIRWSSETPSSFINAFLTLSNIALATIGGTAFPICFRTPVAPNSCSSGKP